VFNSLNQPVKHCRYERVSLHLSCFPCCNILCDVCSEFEEKL